MGSFAVCPNIEGISGVFTGELYFFGSVGHQWIYPFAPRLRLSEDLMGLKMFTELVVGGGGVFKGTGGER